MDAGPSPQCGKGFFSHSQLFVQTLWAVTCVNFCVHIKKSQALTAILLFGSIVLSAAMPYQGKVNQISRKGQWRTKETKNTPADGIICSFSLFSVQFAWLNAMQCKPVKCKCGATDCIFPPPTPAHKWSSRKHQKSVVSLWWLCVWPGEERPGGKVSDGRKVKKNELRQAQKLVKKQQRGREPAAPTWSLLASGLMLLTLVAFCMSFAVE